MKLKNILSILFFLVVAASCSMESDTVMNDISNENIPTGTEKNAYLSFNLNMGEAQTKAASFTEETEKAEKEEAAIKSVIFFLLDNNGNVLNVGNGTDAKILTKVRSGMSVLAVANCSNTEISKLSNKDAILATTVGTTDLSNLVKVGESAVIAFEEGFGDNSTVSAPVKEVTIEVSQVAARIELANLSFKYKANEKPCDVKLTGVALKNQNTNGILARDFVAGGYESVTISKGQTLSAAGIFDQAPTRFYTFANTGDNKTELEISLEVNGKPVVKSYSIKTPKSDNSYDEIVESGNLYRLNVNMIVASDLVEFDVTCYTADWTLEEINADLTEE